MSCHFGLLTLLFALCSLNQVASEVYYITTNSTDICPVQPCLTLPQFAANSSHYLYSNTTLVFLPGTHYLSTENLTLSNVDNFIMKSENSTAQVQCRSDSRMHLSQSQCIHITNLVFIGCGGNQVRHVEEFIVQDTKFDGQENSGTALELFETRAQILNSTFDSNNRGSYRECGLFYPGYGCISDGFIGGAIIATNSTVDVSQSNFESNRAEFGGAIFAEQSSIINLRGNVFVNNSADYVGGVMESISSTITIEISEFYGNSAFWGGVLISDSSTIIIESSEFHNNSDFWGGILIFDSSTITMEANKFHNNAGKVLDSSNSNITIETSKFHDNSGGILFSNSSTITIEASKFYENNSPYGGVLESYSSTIRIEATEFDNNSATNRGGVLDSSNSTITIAASEFHGNSAPQGGVLHSYSSNTTIEVTEFNNNCATKWGGVLHSYSSTITIAASEFHDNSATKWGGVLHSYSSTITIETTEFNNNSATNRGGVLDSTNSTITIIASEFHDNSALQGGVLDLGSSTITIEASDFHDNCATYDGGVLHSYSSTVTIEGTKFNNNSAINQGGVIHSNSSIITIEASDFCDNYATYEGGVLYSSISNITTETSEFHNNRVTIIGGGVIYSFSNTITIGSSNFTKNVSPVGAVIYATDRSKIQHDHNHLIIDNNVADRYAVLYFSDSEFIGHDSDNVITFSNNLGSLVAFNSNITFSRYAIFVNNKPPQPTAGDFQEGGATTLLQSNVFFDGACNLEYNHAENGGAIHSTESKLYVNGNVTIAHNTATRNGGGVYLSTSELNCQQKSTFEFFNNTAIHKGGGLHATSSSIKATFSYSWPDLYTGARLNFTENTAEMGGGLSLEANAKLYILKYDFYYVANTTTFTANRADYGGAVYVDDDTNSGTCASDTKTECFFQVLAIYVGRDPCLNIQSMYYSQNYANISGSTLYGGLLDRCAVSQFAEFYRKYPLDIKDRGDGIAYFRNVSIPTYNYVTYNHRTAADNCKESVINTNLSMSSLPVQVCLCNNKKFNGCTHHRSIQEAKKGETFTYSVVAVDQIGQPVSATIQTSLHFTKSGLAEGQLARKIPAECTNLTFSVVSSYDSESLTLYALDGPCKDAELSKATIEIDFLPCSCAIGLQVSGINSTNCTCECHSDINQYVERCDSHTGSLVKQPQSRAWISYITDTGYLIYPNCPFDYCLSINSTITIDLNKPKGADTQCAFNRSSLLCGSCQSGLSLSLGSSHCLSCPRYWPALLIAITIAAILAGIALVALLLVLNMTVAVGTLNGLIFFANVVYANKSILLPFQSTTIFISWLNLDLGIDTCYFPGMDTYIKTWLQLAFPAYVILLVVLIIIISSYSTKFSYFIGKKDPVATLAALILLSYAKLLEICFKSLSVGILEYPDGSSEMLWLPDATVKYLSGKHIPLFIAALLIFLVGLVYTALLFLWQWLLYLPRWRIFRWSRNPKIQTFIETYNTPYTPKHRYWTGLLLIVRIILYLVAAVNVSSDPTVALTAINYTVCCLFALRLFFGSRLYRKWPVDVLETFFYFNILSFATFAWYSLGKSDSNQEAAVNISVILTFIILLFIILYHVHTYTTILSRVERTRPGRIISRLLTDAGPKSKPERQWIPPPDDDIHRFNELLDVIDRPVNTFDYTVSLKQQKPMKPTQSVVQIHQPHDLAASDSEAADIQHTSEAVQVEVKEADSLL